MPFQVVQKVDWAAEISRSIKIWFQIQESSEKILCPSKEWNNSTGQQEVSGAVRLKQPKVYRNKVHVKTEFYSLPKG